MNEWTDVFPLINMVLLITLCVIVLRHESK